jgi:hypothetical protein
MTDERIDRFPDRRPEDADDGMGDTRDAPDTRDERPPRSTDEAEANPLTREGPDAPDAADIEDPDEQL